MCVCVLCVDTTRIARSSDGLVGSQLALKTRVCHGLWQFRFKFPLKFPQLSDFDTLLLSPALSGHCYVSQQLHFVGEAPSNWKTVLHPLDLAVRHRRRQPHDAENNIPWQAHRHWQVFLWTCSAFVNDTDRLATDRPVAFGACTRGRGGTARNLGCVPLPRGRR